MGKVRVAIIGVGNCASSFVQGLHYYRAARDTDRIPGLMHVNLGGYHIRDVEISAAIDIDKNKVGLDVADAIGVWPNNTYVFTKTPKTGVIVQRGMTHDGLGKYLSKIIEKAPGSTVDIVKLLRDTGTDVVVNYLPVGSEEATKWYVEQVLEAGCAFVNCIPVFIARENYWRNRFEKRGLPVIGDDIKSQVGATITHRVLSRLFVERGVRIDRTYQINFGGNTDFLNMLERERLESKKISKTSAVTSIIPYQLAEGDVHVGPSDYIPWLKDRKWCHIRMEGTTFGDVPLNMELKLEVWDSPNSAGVVIDAVRCAKLGLDHGLKGALVAPSAYFKKSPPVQIPDDEARVLTEAYIRDPKATEKKLRDHEPTVTRDSGYGRTKASAMVRAASSAKSAVRGEAQSGPMSGPMSGSMSGSKGGSPGGSKGGKRGSRSAMKSAPKSGTQRSGSRAAKPARKRRTPARSR